MAPGTPECISTTRMQKLDYETRQRRVAVAPPSPWDTILFLSVLSPFLMVPAFIVGLVLLEDSFVNGNGRSWFHASLAMAIPTGLVIALAAIGCLRVCVSPIWAGSTSIAGLILNLLALLFITFVTIVA